MGVLFNMFLSMSVDAISSPALIKLKLKPEEKYFR